MYSTCLFCKSGLGSNESVEVFPVGRRLAFDGARGRLWVICGRCGRWNLTPLEERWEAIEQCERHFRGTRRRVSTDNIGMAQLPDGVELVRIGRPHRPELAAWRYGGRLLRRRRRHRVEQLFEHFGTSLWLLGAMPVAWPATVPWVVYDLHRRHQTVARLPDAGNGETVAISRKVARKARLLPGEGGEGWVLRIRRAGGMTELTGSEALRTAGLLLPHVNREGAAAAQVEAAVAELERAGGADALFRAAAGQLHRERNVGVRAYDHRIEKAPLEMRLALEMAAHEEAERRALEGELHDLECAWREAEEIAAIADSLLLPPAVEEMLRRLRLRAGERRPEWRGTGSAGRSPEAESHDLGGDRSAPRPLSEPP